MKGLAIRQVLGLFQGPAKRTSSAQAQLGQSRRPGKLFRPQFRTSHQQALRGDVISDLENRQLIAQVTSRAVRQHLRDQSRTVYLGIDPTANSLHAGNLLALIGLLHFTLHGHNSIVLLGGGTGAVGDPSGRSSERTTLSRQVVDENLNALQRQVQRLLTSGLRHAQTRLQQTSDSNAAESPQLWPPCVKNNLEWLSELTLLDFLGSVGKTARVSSMLARDSVKHRLESGAGISFTEFTYQLLQAYDFSILQSRHGCTVQLGGSDQYGNIMSGIEIMTKIGTFKEGCIPCSREIAEPESPNTYGVTMPLLTNSKGEKFGKSAGNALWLSSSLTPPVDLYQAFLRTPDSEIHKYLRMLTFLPLEEIDRVMDEYKEGDRQQRKPQKLLAREIISLVHGSDELEQALLATAFLFPDNKEFPIPSEVQLKLAFKGSPHHVQLPPSKVIGSTIESLAVASNLCKSKGEARSLRQSGAITINHQSISDQVVVSESNLLAGRHILLMRGKTAYKLISISPNAENALDS
ncbi:hypothetical protein CROQUDRAFT_663190 [Cronartium quercuum f. sp. fusiforme G11]|uniref:Tyrosine--tRNA ligase n=1 Tax=Cronartium quercuum f. sp. fusiforme G11 TaxID=708437 RepID=A0A9P6T7X2_9BASI|nr:hypothetical protein CROQUDRAFT_663190 [Cronartium quercuum f. sp. fusiforme G11]